MMEKKIEQKHLVNTKEVCTEIIDKKLEKKLDKITSSTHYSDALMKNIDTNLIGNVVIAAKIRRRYKNMKGQDARTTSSYMVLRKENSMNLTSMIFLQLSEHL